MNSQRIQGSHISIDGTDFSMYEPSLFQECVIAINFQGAFSDVRIVGNGLKNLLLDDEFVIADNGYTYEQCIQPPGNLHPHHKVLAKIRARHEILNKRLKQFRVLKLNFRHDLSLHRYCFFAVLNIRQLNIEEEPLHHINIW